MAAPFSVTPLIGIDLNTIFTAADIASSNPSRPRLGSQVWGTNGRRYVFAQAGGAIGAGVTAASVNPTTFIATATGGAYTSPSVAMATGDQAWFSAASV